MPAYPASPVCGFTVAMELMFTMAPPPCAFMTGTTACVMFIVPITLVSRISFQAFRSASSALAGVPQKKALLTRPSMRPNCLLAPSARRLHCAASRMSVTSLSTLHAGLASRMRFSASSSFSAVRAPIATATRAFAGRLDCQLHTQSRTDPRDDYDLVLE